MTKADIEQAWRDISAEVTSTFTDLSPVGFSSQQVGWSYAQNLDHLIRSADAIANALALPKFLIRILFGKSSQSRTSDEVRSKYLAKLGKGSQAGGKFVPTGSQSQTEMLRDWERVSNKLLKNLDRWSEQQLDTLRLPHPIIGKLTVREMLFFTEFHTRHHLDNCSKKSRVH